MRGLDAGRYYVDHPKRTEVCGLGTAGIYRADAFAESWSFDGPRMKAPAGTGFGFDEILESLSWERILNNRLAVSAGRAALARFSPSVRMADAALA
ncbi:MAG: hypothetical protein HC902_14100 [Calothrix sp. SM1_5_4]|nr:hypothetical protein [Calothrix sp. SM1_5_4]